MPGLNHATVARPCAALSVDLDNLWSYLRAKGDPCWQAYPSFLPTAVPRLRALFNELALEATLFIVGRDAETSSDAAVLTALLADGHEAANHSYSHHPHFHTLSEALIEDELSRTEAALAALGVDQVRGFRAPSYRLSRALLRVLARRGYTYDSSTFPNAVGVLARAWHRRHFGLDERAAAELGDQYGALADMRRPLAPYRWRLPAAELTEVPVSTLPLLRLPVHWTYINFLAEFSVRCALAYVSTHIALCRVRSVAPVLLIHATDVIGVDDDACPRFMPGMRLTAAEKMRLLRTGLARYRANFEVGTVGNLVDYISRAEPLTLRDPERSRLP